MKMIQAFDVWFLTTFRELCNAPWLDTIMLVVSALGDNALIFIIIALCLPKKRVVLSALAVNALFCNVILKPLIARVRPYDLLGYDVLVSHLGDFSFPSGHTSAAFALAAATQFVKPKWGKAMYAFAILMGISRLYLGVHYVTDILCGALLGWLSAKAAIRLFQKMNWLG